MRFGLPIASSLLLSAALGSASALTDPFGQPQANCDYSYTAPYSNCDAIGNPRLYDIQAATFSVSGGMASVMIYLNSGAVQTVNNKLTLGSFNDSGVTLIPGGIFFYNPTTVYDPSDPSTIQYLRYGIAPTNHGSFTAGDLYSIAGGVSTETAQTALNDSSDYYRRDETVLMTGSGPAASSGTVSVANNRNGTTSAQYVISVTVPTTPGLPSLMSNGEIGLLFSSADCGNDVIQGPVGQAPEPGPELMILTGLALLAAGFAWRKRRA
jgi:MYXO-CTERM domain-containing protein